jgi:hypothetical protein
MRAHGEHIRRILLADDAHNGQAQRGVHAQIVKIFDSKIAPVQKAYQYDATRSTLLQSECEQ